MSQEKIDSLLKKVYDSKTKLELSKVNHQINILNSNRKLEEQLLETLNATKEYFELCIQLGIEPELDLEHLSIKHPMMWGASSDNPGPTPNI